MASFTSESTADLDLSPEESKLLLSEYSKKLNGQVKKRYVNKISEIGIDPFLIPKEKLDPECLPPVEASDLISYLVLETSFYTNKQFKAFRSLQAYNQMVSGFIQSVEGAVISKKHVVVAKVRHSQRMNDPLVPIWIISDNDGSIRSAHCSGCMAGLGECCSHVASVLFYLEVWTRLHGKLACTQVKCSWLLPTYVKEVNYAKIANIDFTSARKLKSNLDCSIDMLDDVTLVNDQCLKSVQRSSADRKNPPVHAPSCEELKEFFASLSVCKAKPAILSLSKPYANFFVSESQSIPTIPDLFQEKYLDLSYPELLKRCYSVKIELTNKEIQQIEKDTVEQAKGKAFFHHRAGRIGASKSRAATHTNPALPSQSLIKSICYPDVFKFSTRATVHGCTREDSAIRAYESEMKKVHTNFKVSRCGLLINKQYPFLHATCDFLCSCDCCGLGCGEVKCPFCIEGCDFESYLNKKASCLEKVNGKFCLKRQHDYYFQVQQQLFTHNRCYSDFVVCAFMGDTTTFVHERIYPDKAHWDDQVPKLTTFWQTCILPEILGRWYTRPNTEKPSERDRTGNICYCRMNSGDSTVCCSNPECLIVEFHFSCIFPSSVTEVPNTWYCPDCRRQPQYQSKRKKRSGNSDNLLSEALLLKSICLCKAKAAKDDKLLLCHNNSCTFGQFFHLSCLKYKRCPNNSKTTWMCPQCRACKSQKPSKAPVPSCQTSTKSCVPTVHSDPSQDVTVVGVSHAEPERGTTWGLNEG